MVLLRYYRSGPSGAIWASPSRAAVAWFSISDRTSEERGDKPTAWAANRALLHDETALHQAERYSQVPEWKKGSGGPAARRKGLAGRAGGQLALSTGWLVMTRPLCSYRDVLQGAALLAVAIVLVAIEEDQYSSSLLDSCCYCCFAVVQEVFGGDGGDGDAGSNQ